MSSRTLLAACIEYGCSHVTDTFHAIHSKHHKEMTARGETHRACSLEMTKFYIAEVVLALEYLHENVILPTFIY
jgi:hypothetical protein